MTPLQAKVYRWMLERKNELVQPTMNEMAAALGLASRSSVHRVLADLVALGFVERIHRKNGSRAYRAIGKQPERENRSDVDKLADGMNHTERLEVVFYPGADQPEGAWHVVWAQWKRMSSHASKEDAIAAMNSRRGDGRG
jgi:predicted transcriptional regulator